MAKAKNPTDAKRKLIQIERREAYKEPPPLPSIGGPYGVIYADPPWMYEFSSDPVDSIESHYDTMSLQEICELPVAEIAEKDCVLFLWATSPKLEEAISVLNAWGFTYKTCGVWDKEHIGMGYYFRQRHEILLIGVKGSPGTPLQEDRPDSVYSEKKTTHSTKPEYYYGMIERMYPHLSKVELFCRTPREGWAVWGNEV